MKYTVVTTKMVEWEVDVESRQVAEFVATLAAKGSAIVINGEPLAKVRSTSVSAVNITSTKETLPCQ